MKRDRDLQIISQPTGKVIRRELTKNHFVGNVEDRERARERRTKKQKECIFVACQLDRGTNAMNLFSVELT